VETLHFRPGLNTIIRIAKIEDTETGRREREKRRDGLRPRRNAGEVAIVDFKSDGLEKYLTAREPVLVLFEDSDVPGVRFFRKPPNLLSTTGMLRGLERVGVIQSANAIIEKMTHPTDPSRRAQVLKDLPDGVDEPAIVGSSWTP
jgi:hypothetical protein